MNGNVEQYNARSRHPALRQWCGAFLCAVLFMGSMLLGTGAHAGSLSGTYTNQSCTPGCVASSATWNTNCAGTYSALVAAGTTSVTNTNSGYSGSVTLTCNASGTGAVVQSSASCLAQCAAGTANWNGATTGCSGTYGVLASGGSTSVTNTVSGKGGTVTITCTNGSVAQSGATCTAAASCASATVSWSGTITCSKATGVTLSSGQGIGLTVSTTLKDGYCYAICTNGVLACDGSEYCDSAGCFTGDAMITLADGSTKPIAELKKGDKIRGEKGINTVLNPETHTSSETLYGFNGGPIFVTGEHMLMTTKGWSAIDLELVKKESNGKYHPRQLAAGDTLILEDGKTQIIKSIDQRTDGKTVELYNPSVDGDHTYYSNGILVHNSKSCSTC